jgi:hypothetical protein
VYQALFSAYTLRKRVPGDRSMVMSNVSEKCYYWREVNEALTRIPYLVYLKVKLWGQYRPEAKACKF